jgi:amidase
MARGSTLSHRDWLAANELRHRMRLEWAKFFENYDLLLCPAASTTAMKHDQKGERYERRIPVNGKFVPPTDQMFWAGYSGMAYLPSTVAPIGFNAEKLPIGVQIIGPQYGDRTCIQFAELIERDYQAFEPPPAYDLAAAQ